MNGESLIPSNKAISSFKRHFKIAVGEETRHFYHKTYGSPKLALMACETFQKECNALLHVFDANKRKPEPRRELLVSAGCDPKFLKSSIANQREALIRRLTKGKVSSVETKVLAHIFADVGQELDSTCCKITTADDKFKAVFEGGKHHVEKIFSSVTAAVEWLQSMSLAEKVWFFFLKTIHYSTLQYSTILQRQ